MGSVYARHNKLWIKHKSVDGVWRQRATEFVVGQEQLARAVLESLEKKIADGAKLGEADFGPVTVEMYAKQWIDDRRPRVRSVSDEESRLSKHVLPRIGKMRLDEVRPKHIRDVVLALRSDGHLAPRTIRTVYGVLHALFRDALVDELVTVNPCVLKKGVLPKKVDKDPAWRSTAIFNREEVEALISDERVLLDRRVVYALKALAGRRHGEVAGLRWERYDPSAQPLGRLTVASSYTREGTKTDVTREVPVHPTLALLLAEWKRAGWEATYGREPKPADLIVPTRRFNVREPAEAHWAFQRDLERLGLRARRGHDLRRTFITLAQVDGARQDLLEVVSHGPRGDIVSIYTTFPWPAVCGEVAKLKVELRRGLGTALGTAAATTQNHSEKRATPTGTWRY